jgi:hypothetical protein
MKFSVFLLSMVIFAGLAGSANGGAWFKAENTDCTLWNPDPDDEQKVRWGGQCKDGKAQGDGVAEWFSYQRPPDRCECSLVDGKVEGTGIYRWADGVTYVGEFKASVIEGKGFIKYPDNEMYEGDFKNGLPHGWGVQMLPNNKRVTGNFKNGAFMPPR